MSESSPVFDYEDEQYKDPNYIATLQEFAARSLARVHRVATESIKRLSNAQDNEK